MSIDLQAMARQVMLAQGFEPNFPPATQQQLAEISAHPPQLVASDKVRDLRGLLWSSIDNDTSKDLDQIEVAERLPNGDIKVMVGIADVDAFVGKDSAIDQHAAKETTSVYTGVAIFPMLPDELSTGASSLLLPGLFTAQHGRSARSIAQRSPASSPAAVTRSKVGRVIRVGISRSPGFGVS